MKSPKLLSMRYDHHFTSYSSCLFDQSYCSVFISFEERDGGRHRGML